MAGCARGSGVRDDTVELRDTGSRAARSDRGDGGLWCRTPLCDMGIRAPATVPADIGHG